MLRIATPFGWPLFARTGTKRTDLIDKIQDAAAGRAQLEGAMLGPAYLRCDDGATLKIGPIARSLLGNANATLKTTAETVYTPTSPALANGTRYHLFVRNVSGVLTFAHVAAIDGVPDGSGVFKFDGTSVDETWRYIGTFATRAGATEILRFRARRGRYTYQTSGIAAGALVAIAGANDTTYQTLALGPWVPAHTDQVRLSVSLHSTSGSCNAFLKTNSGDTSEDEYLAVNATAAVDSREIEMVTSDSQTIQYMLSSASGQLSIAVKGFQE